MIEIDSEKITKLGNDIYHKTYDYIKKELDNFSVEELNNAFIDQPLARAVRARRIDIIKLLLEKGIDINIVSNDKYSALSEAITNNTNEWLNEFIFSKNNYKRNDIKEIIKVLLDNGADINFLPDENTNLELIKLIFDYKKDDIYYIAKLLIFDKSLVDEYIKLIKKD